MEQPKIIREVKFHHEENGLCYDTFYCDEFKDGRRYYNRDTEDGTWYTTYPSGGYYEHNGVVKPEIEFHILNKKGKCEFIESNGSDEKTFRSFNDFLGEIIKKFAIQHKLHDAKALEFYLTKDGYEPKNKDSDWIYVAICDECEKNKEKIVEYFSYLGIRFDIYFEKYHHENSNKDFICYGLKNHNINDKFYCNWTIGYSY